MGTREGLQTVLENVLGSRNVYYQPPESVKMHYPAIVYSLSGIDNDFANNSVYNQKRSYDITVIDDDPDSSIVDRLSMMSGCRFSRHFASDNLYHDVFTLYY